MGQDQPGILSAVSSIIDQRHGNIENLSQSLMQSVFAALLLVSAPESETPEALQKALIEGTLDLQLKINVHPGFPESTRVKPDVQPYIVAAMGPDRQGLVAAVSSQLALHDVNITNMQAVFKGGDNALDNMMIFEVDVPRHTIMQNLRDALKKVSEKLSLEISIQHRKIFESVSNIQD